MPDVAKPKRKKSIVATKFFKSKTLIVNGIFAVLGAAVPVVDMLATQLSSDTSAITPFISEQYIPIVVTGVAVVNIILRYLTTKPLEDK